MEFVRKASRFRIGWLPALCLVLVTLTASVQAAHIHPDLSVKSDCQLCLIAHHTVLAQTTVPLHAPTFHLISIASVLDASQPEEGALPARNIRPPPAS